MRMRYLVFALSMGSLCTTIGCQSTYSATYHSQSTSPNARPVPTATPVPAVQAAVRLPSNYPSRPLATPSAPAPTPCCEAVCVMDALTGNVLYEHNGNTKRQVASTQKLVSSLVVLDHGSLNKLVTITTEDTKADPTKLGFRPGQQYRRGDLLHALMVKSYNDVALALARDTAGSVPRFVSMMNAKARSMGMRNSHFANPNGLPASQYSTAVDMARCTWFAYRHPVLRSMVSTRSMEFSKADGRSVHLENTNKLLAQYSWVTGMKTGYTNAARRCLVSTGGVNGRHVIVVVLGCAPSRIWTESSKYLKWALNIS